MQSVSLTRCVQSPKSGHPLWRDRIIRLVVSDWAGEAAQKGVLVPVLQNVFLNGQPTYAKPICSVVPGKRMIWCRQWQGGMDSLRQGNFTIFSKGN
jgi:hypothetical protein